MPLLEVDKLGIIFGGLHAVENFSMTIEKGELYGLIGPNGAGKTTVFNMLTGVYKPTSGSFSLDGEVLSGGYASSCQHADDCDRSGGDEVSGRTGCFQSGNCQRAFP